MSINDRIALILQDKNLTANEFALRLKVQSSNISHIITGRNKPSFTFLEKLALEFPEISTDWLIRGEGNMYINSRNNNDIKEKTEYGDDIIVEDGGHPYQNSLFDMLEEKTEAPSPYHRTESVGSHEEDPLNKEIERKTGEKEERIAVVNTNAARIKSIIVYFNNGSFQEFLPK